MNSICTKCGEVKDGNNPYRCKSCTREYDRQYREKNKEKIKGNWTDWYKRNIEKSSIRVGEWRKKNKEKANKHWREWRTKNGKNAEYDNARRARERNAEGRYTASEFTALCEKYENKCLKCGEEKKLTADHVVPLIAGGSNGIDNIQPLCKSCNSSKGTKTIDYRK